MASDPQPLPRQRSREVCPFCQAAQAQALLRTVFCVYLRCGTCNQVWTVPERRALPRPTDISRVF
jgi:hypothetical protein